MKKVLFLIFLFLSFLFAESDFKIIIPSSIEGDGIKWNAVGMQEGDFEVRLKETDKFKIKDKQVLEFYFKRITATGFANKHARIEVRISKGFNLLNTENKKAYLNLRPEKLPSSFKVYFLAESPYANSTEDLSKNFDVKYLNKWISIELDAGKIWGNSKTTPKIDTSKITRIFIAFHMIKENEEGVVYVGPITDKPIGEIINSDNNEEKKEVKEKAEIKKLTPIYKNTLSLDELKNKIKKIDVPIYLQEFHIWYTSPFGKDARDGWIHWVTNFEDNIELPQGNGWRRNTGSIGYPLIGYYDSGVEEVIRWQIRCMKNAGFDGVFVQLFPVRWSWCDGTSFGRGEDIFAKILEIAKQENFKVGIHDEVQFRKGWKAQEPDVMIERISNILKKFGDHPAYLKINGKPAYNFQCWDLFQKKLTFSDLEKILKESEKKLGKDIFFIVGIHPQSGATKINGIDAMISAGNAAVFVKNTPYNEFSIDWEGLEKYQIGPTRPFREEMRNKNIQCWMWAYPGFNNTSYLGEHKHWFDRRDGLTFIEVLNKYAEEKVDAIIVSSWNDWFENTAIEPGLAYDDFSGDPYLYLKIIASAKGKQFSPPPFPKPEAVDPWLHSQLYGIDRTPPLITEVWYSPLEPSLEVSAYDEDSKIERVKLLKYGNSFVRFTEPIYVYNANLIFTPGLEYYDEVEGIKTLSLSKLGNITIEIPNFKYNGEEWLHITYFDGMKGRIKIKYPAKIIEFVDTDIPMTDYSVAVCNGEKKWKDKFIRLRGITQKEGNLLITIEFTASTKEQQKDVLPVLLGAVSFINDFSNGIEGVQRKIKKENTNGGNFVFNNIIFDNSPFDLIFLQAYDERNNASLPYVVNLGVIKNKYRFQKLK